MRVEWPWEDILLQIERKQFSGPSTLSDRIHNRSSYQKQMLNYTVLQMLDFVEIWFLCSGFILDRQQNGVMDRK